MGKELTLPRTFTLWLQTVYEEDRDVNWDWNVGEYSDDTMRSFETTTCTLAIRSKLHFHLCVA